jgi:hypothetical protein
MTPQDAAIKSAPIIMAGIIEDAESAAGFWLEFLHELTMFCEATIGAEAAKTVVSNLKAHAVQ